jgi:hypothetical protein
MVSTQCPGMTKDGAPCSAQVLSGRTFCHWHDPERRDAARESRRKGGQNRAAIARARKLLRMSDGMADVQARLLLVYQQVHIGEVDPSVGTAMATIARALVAVAGVAQFEDQLTEMRREIADLRGAS